MRFPGFSARPLLVALALGVTIAFVSPPALAIGEEITDVRVMGNQRTEESTVRSVAGVSIGDTLNADTLDTVRERLNTTGLFSDVNVWWEQHKSGVRVNISVKDKFPWAPVPTGSWGANNKAFGLLFVHGNLFGRGKQLLLGGRLATVDSGAVLGYRDPAFLGTWIYWQLQGAAQRQDVPEFRPADAGADLGPFRATLFTSFSFEPALGIAWFRRVRTQVSWRIEKVNVEKSYLPTDESQAALALPTPGSASLSPTQTTQGVTMGVGRANLSFDFRAREFAVMTGTSLGGGIDYATSDFGSQINFWRVGGGVEHGIKFFKSHNFVYNVGATFGKNLPFWMENNVGGPSMRGYLYQQFRGDSQVRAEFEYHFPLFSIGSLDFRALGFYEIAALWFRELPMIPAGADPNTDVYVTRNTLDARTFLIGPNGVQQGFNYNRDIHQSVGGGLRFFLRSVSVPLVGFDAGYGLESQSWRFILVVGA
jgi:outer membrane protein insertion porin family